MMEASLQHVLVKFLVALAHSLSVCMLNLGASSISINYVQASQQYVKFLWWLPNLIIELIHHGLQHISLNDLSSTHILSCVILSESIDFDPPVYICLFCT